MRWLLDTHVALWLLTNSSKLPENVVNVLRRQENELFVSVASIWEVAIKHFSRPEDILMSEVEYADYCEEAGFRLLPSKLSIFSPCGRWCGRMLRPSIMIHSTES